ncbi:MAG: hypothetical protein AAF211_30205 [Myxococcota bacterium]
MQEVLDTVDRRTREFEAHGLFEALRDDKVRPEAKLAVVPPLAHFVMSFADIYAHVLREEPTEDAIQQLVNAHTREDGGHWKWFVADLEKLGFDPDIGFADTLRFLWSDALLETRRLSYGICRLGLDAAPLTRLAMVLSIEATGAVTLAHLTPIGQAFADRTGQRLVYFGAHHLETEQDHTLEEASTRATLEAIELSAAQRTQLDEVVNRVFDLFTAGADDLLAFVRVPERLAPWFHGRANAGVSSGRR